MPAARASIALLAFLALAASLAGCKKPPEPLEPPCGVPCGSDAATLGADAAGGDIFFHELDGAVDAAAREPNAAGVRFEELIAPDGQTRLELVVEGDRLRGRLPQPVPGTPGDDGFLDGPELHGATLVLSRADASGAITRYLVELRRTISTTFWSEPRDALLAYELFFRVEGSTADAQPVCDCDLNVQENWDDIRAGALIFRGDRYTTSSITVAGPETRWINIACAGTAFAKMHLMRQTEASSRPDLGIVASIEQRNAVLKMLTADYCGSGGSFARIDEPVHHVDTVGSYGTLADGDELEAVWGPDGAVCLDAPRSVTMESVQAECRRVQHALPTCASWRRTSGRDEEDFVRSAIPASR